MTASEFAVLFNRECDAAIAASDAKAREMDEHGYGGKRDVVVLVETIQSAGSTPGRVAINPDNVDTAIAVGLGVVWTKSPPVTVISEGIERPDLIGRVRFE